MSIPANTTGKVQYTGDGTTKTFPLTFPIFKTTGGVYAIRVSVAAVTGENVEVMTEGTDYTVDDSGNSFYDVVMDTAPASGKVVTIIYSNEFSQLYEPTDFTRLPAKSLINAFDKLTAICIQMSEELNRCVKESVESPVDPQVVVDKVNALYLHLSALTALSEHLTEIDAVYADLSKVVIDANNISDINTVALDIDKINALAAITMAISSCYNNMAAILDAPTQASAAAGSATKAQNWAVKMDGKIDEIDYSSKYYADLAKKWATSSTIVESGKYGASFYALQAYNANVSAQNAKTRAQEWAAKTDGAVEAGEYSAKYYAGEADSSANSAAASAEQAEIFAIDAAKRNVGDLFYTSRKGNLPGAVDADGAVYNSADFTGEGSVPALLESGDLPYVSMIEYERILSGDPINGTLVGTIFDEGRIMCVSSGSYFQPDKQIPLGAADTWEFQTRWTNRGSGGSERYTLFGSNETTDFKNPLFSVLPDGRVQLHIGYTGNSWDIAAGALLGLTIAIGETYDLKLGFDGTQYYFAYKLPAANSWITSWTLVTTQKCYATGNIILGNMRLAAAFSALYFNNGAIHAEQTQFKLNGEVYWRAGAGRKALNSCQFFGWDGQGSLAFRVPKAEKTKRVLVYSKIPTADSTYGELLYSDGYYVCWDNWNNAGSTAPGSEPYFRTIYLPRNFLDNNYDIQLSSGVGQEGWHFGNGALVGYGYPGADGKNLSKGTNWFKFSMATGAGTVYFGYRVSGYTTPPREDEYQFQNIEVHRAMVQIAHGTTDEALVVASSVIPRMNAVETRMTTLENRFQPVSALPANPDPNTFYFVLNGV